MGIVVNTDAKSRWSHRWMLSITCFVVLLAGTFGFALYSSAGDNSEMAPDSSLSLASLNLVDQHGNRLKKSDVKDRLVLMNFFFTSCSSACPIQTAVLKDVIENVDPSVDVLFLSISIAPLTDTPQAVDQYLAKYDIQNENWKFVTTSVADTDELIDRFAVTLDNAVVIDNQIDHRNMGYLFGKSGMLMQQYQLTSRVSKRLVRELKELSTLEPQA